MQSENLERLGLKFIRPWLEGGGRLYPENWRCHAVSSNRRVAILARKGYGGGRVVRVISCW